MKTLREDEERRERGSEETTERGEEEGEPTSSDEWEVEDGAGDLDFEDYGDVPIQTQESLEVLWRMQELPNCHWPLMWDPNEKQFELLWDLLDPRASVLGDSEEDSRRERLERVLDCLVDVIKCISNVTEQKEGKLRFTNEELEDVKSIVDELSNLVVGSMANKTVDTVIGELLERVLGKDLKKERSQLMDELIERMIPNENEEEREPTNEDIKHIRSRIDDLIGLVVSEKRVVNEENDGIKVEPIMNEMVDGVLVKEEVQNVLLDNVKHDIDDKVEPVVNEMVDEVLVKEEMQNVLLDNVQQDIEDKVKPIVNEVVDGVIVKEEVENVLLDNVQRDVRGKMTKILMHEFDRRVTEINTKREKDILVGNLRKLQHSTELWLASVLNGELRSSPFPKLITDKIIIPSDPALFLEKEREKERNEKKDMAKSEVGSLESFLANEICDAPFGSEGVATGIVNEISDAPFGSEGVAADVVKEICDAPFGSEDAAGDVVKEICDAPFGSEDAAADVVNELLDDSLGSKGVATGVVDAIFDAPFDTEIVASYVVDMIYDTPTESERVATGLLNEIYDIPFQAEEAALEVVHSLIDRATQSISTLGSEDVAGESESASDDTSTVLARFHLENERCFSRKYAVLVDLNDVQMDLAMLCKVPANMIVVDLDGTMLISNDILIQNITLKELRHGDESEMDFNLRSHDDLRYPLRTYELTQETPRVQTRIVDVIMDKYETRRIRLTVLDDCIVKPYIGGHRNKASGIELHNAFSQTGPPRKHRAAHWHRGTHHRDTQTTAMRNINLSTVNHKTTQMWRDDCYISPEYDRIMTSRPYVEADVLKKQLNVDEKAATIQHAWKSYLMTKLVKELCKRARECREWEILREKARLREIGERHKLDLVHKTYPRTKADFDMWYAMIEKWRLEQTEIARDTQDKAGRKASLHRLLLTEVELLREIDEHRTRLKEEKREKHDLALIEKCSKPIAWTGKNGCLVTMDTKRTQRARELRDLYFALARYEVTLEERMELLMTLKYALVPYNTVLSAQLTKLVERESELLLSGLKHPQLHMLRQRINKLYVELLKDPEFNPEAAKHSLEYNIVNQQNTFHFCPRCSRLKKKLDATLGATTESLKHCTTCDWVQHIGSRRYDMGPYRDLMRAIRRDEAKRKAYSSVAFVMRDVDFYWLIENLWHAESFLTEADDINDMRMPRWDVQLEWSPWNCILLTDDETKWHLQLETVESGYSSELMGEVHNKHVTARLHFHQLVKTDKYFRESCKWFQVSRRKTYVPPSVEADAFN